MKNVKVLVLRVIYNMFVVYYYEEVKEDLSKSIISLSSKFTSRHPRDTDQIIKELKENNYAVSNNEVYTVVDGVKIESILYCSAEQVFK